MENIKIAWRNLWRNKRRTLITGASVFFGVILSTMSTSLQEGTYEKMIQNIVSFYSGYIQLHHPDYWENKTINNTLEQNDSLLNILKQDKRITMVVPRLESFTLISTGETTKGGLLIGIDPKLEDSLTTLSKWVKEGSYLQQSDDGVLLAKNIAKNLGVTIGDTLVLLSQGYHGVSAAALAPVRGILHFPSPQMNNMGLYMELNHAREFFSTPNRLTSYVIMTGNDENIHSLASDMKSTINGTLSVMTWDEMQPEIKQMIEGDRAGGVIMKFILFLLIGFGILGTVIMMIAERRKEFGVMVAIGLKKARLISILLWETLFIGLLGVVSGFIVSIPLIYTFVKNPIALPEETAKAYEEFGMEAVLFFSNSPEIFFQQVLIVFLITLFIAFYPISSIIRLKVSNALHS